METGSVVVRGQDGEMEGMLLGFVEQDRALMAVVRFPGIWKLGLFHPSRVVKRIVAR